MQVLYDQQDTVFAKDNPRMELDYEFVYLNHIFGYFGKHLHGNDVETSPHPEMLQSNFRCGGNAHSNNTCLLVFFNKNNLVQFYVFILFIG